LIIALMLLGMFGLILINVPIAIGLGVVAVVAMIATQGLHTLPDAALVMYDSTLNFPFLAVPMFIFAGAIMNTSGISRRLVAFSSALFGFIRGGLAMVTTGATLFFAEMSGSAVADVAALGSILIPAMVRKGYSKNFAAAVASSSATLAVIIPPSIPMIIYAAVSGCSVVKLFVAGIIPGILGGFLMMFVSYLYSRRHGYPVENAFQLRQLWITFKDASWTFLIPVIILGGIFGGFVTATEGGGLAVVAALFIGGVVYRELEWKHLYKTMIEGGVTTAVVMLLVATSALDGAFFTELQIPQKLSYSILSLTHNHLLVLALLNVFFLIIGCFVHSAVAIILVVPIVIPLIQALGIDPVHFGIIVTVNLGIGQQTPPVATVLITACSVAKADIWEVTKVNIYYIACSFLVLLLVTYVPDVPMLLVRLFYG
jgi:C4-dicarboxylate transporter DctM subunit